MAITDGTFLIALMMAGVHFGILRNYNTSLKRPKTSAFTKILGGMLMIALGLSATLNLNTSLADMTLPGFITLLTTIIYGLNIVFVAIRQFIK